MAMARNGQQPDKYEQVDEWIHDLQDQTRLDFWYKIKRSPATREAAMAGIVSELEAGQLPLEELDMRCLTIFALCGASIKKGCPTEARLAYRAVALMLLTLRDGSPGALLDEAFPALSKAIQTHGEAPPAEAPPRSSASPPLPSPARSRSAKLRNRTPETTSPAVLAAAVSEWTFLLTTVVSATDTQRKARAGWSAAIASLAEMLDGDDRRVRMAAGEALAVCVELNLMQHAKGNDDMGGALAAKVSDLANEPAGKRADNSLLREQKELFGQIAALLYHGEPPVASWEWHDMMKVSTWVRLAQLNFLRKFLGNGFLEHAQGNPLLNEAFSFGRVEGKPLSIHKKESSMQIDDFLRDLKRNRDWSWECKHIYCLRRMAGETKRLPQNLLQLGWP